MRLPGLCACLPGHSVLGMWFEGDKPDLMCLDIKETHVGPVCRQWNVCLFKSDAIRIQLGGPVFIKAAMNIGNNGLYDLLFYCWINLGIGGDEGMEITTRDGDAPGVYIPPWLSVLSSCSCIVVIKGSRCDLFRAVPPMRFGTLVAVMDVTAAEDPYDNAVAPGGGQSERSEWLPKVSQWAGLGALSMRAH